MRIRAIIMTILTGLSAVNCSIDVSIEDVTVNDFLNSSILATSRGISDGQSNATATILLKNSNGSLVINFQPSFDFINNNGSTGITLSQCSISNDQGLSTCIIRSTSPGMRRLSFNNVLVELIGDIYFDPPDTSATFLQIVSSGQIDQDAGGYSVTSHVGSPFTGLMQEVNGYKVFTNTTDSITPTN